MSRIQDAWVWCRRFRHRRGYGVHSPFSFHLITSVIYEELPYYAFPDLDKERRRHLKNCRHLLPDKKYRTGKTDKLLFRLVNYIRPSTLLEIGTSSGLSALYMSSARKSVRCISVDSENGANKFAGRLLNGIENVELHVGDLSQNLQEIVSSLQKIDFLHLNHSYASEEILEKCLDKVHSRTLMVVEGIYASKEMRSWWKKTVNDERVGIVFDLYSVGIVFFDKTKIKQCYTVNF